MKNKARIILRSSVSAFAAIPMDVLQDYSDKKLTENEPSVAEGGQTSQQIKSDCDDDL